MTRTMYDSVDASKIPSNAQMVAGYVDGRYKWSDADWERFPHATKVRIAVFASTNDGHVLDVEPGNATPEQAVQWVVMRRKSGADPSVYCNYATWPEVRQAFQHAGVQEPHYWIAWWDGKEDIPDSAVAHQWRNAGDYDISVVADYWPGVDAPPKPQPAPAPQTNTQGTAAQGMTVTWLDAQGQTHVVSCGARTQQAIAQIPFDVLNDGIYFALQVRKSDGTMGGIAHIQLDTGAFETLVNPAIAAALGLPNLGATAVSGIGGQDTNAYKSQMDVVLGEKVYPAQPCIVDPAYPMDGLFGAKFLVDNGISLDIDMQRKILTFYS